MLNGSQVVRFPYARRMQYPPIDWGLSFAWSQKRALLLLSMLPFVIEVISSWVLFNHRVDRGDLLLLFVMTSLVNVWVIATMVILAVETVRGDSPKVFAALRTALVHLPKPFISYVLVTAVVMLGLATFVLPGLMFMGFLLWAPAFCVAEMYAQATQPVSDDSVEPGSVELDETQPYFADSAPWDIGFVRSSRVASTQFGSSFQLAFLLLASALVPRALIGALSFGEFNFGVHVLQNLGSAIVGVLALGAWAGAFVASLPRDALAEIGVTHIPSPAELFSDKRVRGFRLEGRVAPHVIIVVLTAISSWLVIAEAERRLAIPDAVQLEQRAASIRNSELRVELTMDDPAAAYRWFSPDLLLLRTGGGQSFAGEFDVDAEEQPEQPKHSYTKPKRVEVYDSENNLLPSDNISPHEGAIKIVLLYLLSRESKEVIEKTEQFSLVYPRSDEHNPRVIAGQLQSAPDW